MELTVEIIREHIRDMEEKLMYIIMECIDTGKLEKVSMYHGGKSTLEVLRNFIDTNMTPS